MGREPVCDIVNTPIPVEDVAAVDAGDDRLMLFKVCNDAFADTVAVKGIDVIGKVVELLPIEADCNFRRIVTLRKTQPVVGSMVASDSDRLCATSGADNVRSSPDDAALRNERAECGWCSCSNCEFPKRKRPIAVLNPSKAVSLK
jgi:hypothetical protein